MASLLPGYEYDIFISYRQKDNKGDRWVNEFVEALKTELESTFKEEISVYFDINPHDGLLETHDVNASLEEKLKCLIFIPIISRTYCDPKSFVQDYPDCPNLYTAQAILSFTLSDTVAAKRYIDKYISLAEGSSSSEADIKTTLAYIYSEAGNLDKAETYYRQALALEPEKLDRLYNLMDVKGWRLYKYGKYKEALVVLQKADSIEFPYYYSPDLHLHLLEIKKAIARQK